MNLGKIIKKRRLEKKIGLREFAKMVDRSPTYISFIENQDSFPSEELIKTIAKLLDFDSDYLLAEAGKISSDIIQAIIDNPELVLIIRNKIKLNDK